MTVWRNPGISSTLVPVDHSLRGAVARQGSRNTQEVELMNKSTLLTIVVSGVILVGVSAGQGLRADEQHGGGSMADAVTPLLKAAVAGAEGKEVVIAHVSAPPGFATPKHHHPGQVFVYVVEGSVTLEVEGTAPVKLGPGDVFEEPPGQSMVGRNLSSTHGAELVVFQIGDAGAPLQIDED